MINILNCTKCELHCNQKPLLDKNTTNIDVMWIGLSAKKVTDINKDIPLSNDTNTGKIIESIESNFKNVNFYKSNLVKCLPLDDNGKIRYPNKKEMESCLDNILEEIKILKPKLIFILGNNVGNFLIKKIDKLDNVKILKIYHPSYIYTYKKNSIDKYIKDVISDINLNLNN